jgi:transcription initiation factor TFIIIB Brf1 subunit/transcription initiation factor TFIIB
MKKIKCQRCNSSDIGINEYSEHYCKNCGCILSNYPLADFVEFENIIQV